MQWMTRWAKLRSSLSCRQSDRTELSKTEVYALGLAHHHPDLLHPPSSLPHHPAHSKPNLPHFEQVSPQSIIILPQPSSQDLLKSGGSGSDFGLAIVLVCCEASSWIKLAVASRTLNDCHEKEKNEYQHRPRQNLQVVELGSVRCVVVMWLDCIIDHGCWSCFPSNFQLDAGALLFLKTCLQCYPCPQEEDCRNKEERVSAQTVMSSYHSLCSAVLWLLTWRLCAGSHCQSIHSQIWQGSCMQEFQRMGMRKPWMMSKLVSCVCAVPYWDHFPDTLQKSCSCMRILWALYQHSRAFSLNFQKTRMSWIHLSD